MILYFSYEELTAVKAGAALALGRADVEGGVRVAAPAEVVAEVEALLDRLDGDLSLSTLADQQRVERAIGHIAERLHERMHDAIVDQYVGSEEAVVAYFDYAHVFAIYDRVRQMGGEMRAMFELMTGEPPGPTSERGFHFPD